MASVTKERSLEETPTWAVAVVCAVIVIISILLEHGIHSLAKWFQKKHKKAMLETLEKLKAELMLLGFISLLLTVGTTYIAKICAPLSVGETLLPCGKNGYDKGGNSKGGDNPKRKLISFSEYHHDDVPWHRVLAGADNYGEYCTGKCYHHGSFKGQSWHSFTWVAFIPLAILVSVGTKLELVIMEMAQQIEDRTSIVRGAPIVEPSNSYFWFNKPRWVLVLIHFTSFQNAFQMAYFLWAWYEFGFYSCHREKLLPIVLRIALGIALQFICSYITFPLYVLVAQMGSHMKKAIFEEQTAKGLSKWRKAAQERKKIRTKGGDASYSGFMSGNTTPSGDSSSPIHLLHKYNNYKPSHATPASPHQHESLPNSPMSYRSDMELSETDISSHGGHHATKKMPYRPHRIEENYEIDFSFSNP